MRLRHDSWTVQEHVDGQWHDLETTTRFADAVRILHDVAGRRLVRNGNVLRVPPKDDQPDLFEE